jgi:hypothetical protein
MKRLLITTLVIGVGVAFAVGALHASKSLAGIENAGARLVSDYVGATRIVGEKWQYVFILLVALTVAWLSLSIVPRWRSRLLVGLLLVELFALSWVCSLHRVFFQPIPSVLALVFALKAGRLFYGGTARIWCEHFLPIAFLERNFAALATAQLRSIPSQNHTQ